MLTNTSHESIVLLVKTMETALAIAGCISARNFIINNKGSYPITNLSDNRYSNMVDRTGRYTIVDECNNHGTVMLREYPRNETLYVVEYDDPDVEETLSSLDSGTVVEIDLRRAGRRGNAWCAESVRPVELL